MGNPVRPTGLPEFRSFYSMPVSLQILVTSFLVSSSFCLRDFLYFKFPFCLSCLVSKKSKYTIK